MHRLMIGAFISFVVIAVAGTFFYYNTSEQVHFTVTGKERVVNCDGDGDCNSIYLVFTDNTTYSIQDSLVKFRFNSSDVYGRIREDQTCTATAYGWRIGFLSTYQNLFDIHCE